MPAAIFKNLFKSSSETKSITDTTAKLISNLKLRKNSVKYKVVLGHEIGGVLLTEPTYCSRCSELIWGLVGQRCKHCQLVSHKRCLDLIVSGCARTHPDTIRPSHQFKITQFWKPTFCDHCGILIPGLFNQGQECSANGCSMKVHNKCIEDVGDICGHRDMKTPRHNLNENENDKIIRSRTDIKDFKLIKIIGAGSYGKVYLAKRENREYAIKVVKKTEPVVSSDPESTLTEMEVLKIGRSYQFLTTAHCCFQSRDRLFFVMEYIEGRDLLYHIEKSGKFSEERTKFYSAEIILALIYLHNRGIVHRDIKLEHVMLDKHGHCKLLDFGMSKDLNRCSEQKTRTFCGTPDYMSPEVCERLDYGTSVDWWALGVLMFAMLLDYFPFDDEGEEEKIYENIKKEPVQFPRSLSDDARSILEGLLTKDPRKRLGCRILEDREQEILRHQFYTGNKSSNWWLDVEAQRIPPPYRPTSDDLEQPDEPDIEARLTPISQDKVKKIQQSDFEGFSFRSESFEPVRDLI